MSRFAMFTALAVLCGTLPASAATLNCRSVNGNVTCSGDGAASCQTIDGRTVCTGGHGAVVQSFGATTPDTAQDDSDDAALADRDVCDLLNSAPAPAGASSGHAASRATDPHPTRSSPPCAALSQP